MVWRHPRSVVLVVLLVMNWGLVVVGVVWVVLSGVIVGSFVVKCIEFRAKTKIERISSLGHGLLMLIEFLIGG